MKCVRINNTDAQIKKWWSDSTLDDRWWIGVDSVLDDNIQMETWFEDLGVYAQERVLEYLRHEPLIILGEEEN